MGAGLDKNKDDGKYEGKTLEVGYDQNIYEAGYAKYAIGKYVWWQALIAIVLTLVITGSTTIIWETETAKEKEANSKK